jgi:capsular polysaccharide transport system permease protein
MSGGLGTSSTTQDVFIVADYIRSRTIIEDLGGKETLFDVYSRGDVDWLSRLSPRVPLEKAWRYWNRKVSAVIDTPSGIITLDVRAFRPDDAQRLARAILDKSEVLVNEISERSRRDAMMRAMSEVRMAEDRLRKARAELADFRNKNNLIDPMLSAKTINDNIGKLLQDRVALENNRATLGNSVTPDSPMLRVLNAQIAALDQQISNLRNQLTSQSKDDALSTQMAGYETRQIEVQFAERLYSIAQDAYDAARREQEKQQLYLITVEQPSTPEKPTYPRIFLDTLTVFAACLALWSMAALLVASVRDHMGG